MRSSGWKGKPETFERINKAISSWKAGKAKWFVNKFGYDGLPDPMGKSDTTEKDDSSSQKLRSFVAYLGFTSSEDYKLYNSWTLDNASDVHVCNNI